MAHLPIPPPGTVPQAAQVRPSFQPGPRFRPRSQGSVIVAREIPATAHFRTCLGFFTWFVIPRTAGFYRLTCGGTTRAMQSMWAGTLVFGLVEIPVRLGPATR